jgi:subtilase family serine protease
MGAFMKNWKWVYRLTLAAVAIITFIFVISTVHGTAQAAKTMTPATKSGNRYTIRGHIVPKLAHQSSIGPTTQDRTIQLSISLPLQNQDALDSLLAAQNDPHSTGFHQYLTSDEFNRLFAPSQATVNDVTSYLNSQGLKVGNVSTNHTLIDASGTVAQVEKAFQVNLADYNLNGRKVYAPTNEPSIPTSLNGMILNIAGLDDVAQYRHPQASMIAHAGSGPGGGYTPTELRTAYDITSLDGTYDGTGQTVAIFELDGYKSSDVNAYLSNYSLGSSKYSNVLVDGATNTAGSGAIEVELDMEVVSAIAPGATQKIYIGPNTTSGVNDTYNKIVTDNTAKVTSISWGECEASSGNSELASLDQIFKQGAAQGQAFFAASGDSGAYDCGTSSLAVDSPADDPYVVGVGGTHLNTTSGGAYSSETVWSSGSGSSGEGGGGGISTYFTRPSYQTGTNLTNTYREVPDVSADADPNSGYSVYCTVTAAQCSSSQGWTAVGGTSAAAPLWAGVATATNQYLAAQSKPTLGSAITTIYKLYNTAQTYTAYHDVTSGNNLYYSATTGYDNASGIGTPDVWNFARDAAGTTTTTNDFSISANPTTLSVKQGASGTSTIGTDVVSGSGTVSLTASVSPSGPTVSLSPTSVTAGNSSTLTVNVGSSVSTGTYTVTVTGTEGSSTHSTTVSVSVISSTSNDFSLSASPTTLSIAQGSSGTSTLSTTVASGSAGTVSLTASVSPTGPTVSLSPTSVTAGGSSTLTVSVGSSVATGTYTVTVTGTEGSATHSAAVTVTVISTGGTTTQLLSNAGFENGQSPWQESSSSGYQIIDTNKPHTGSYSAWLCGYDNCTDAIWQTVALPSAATKITLSYWVYIDTEETTTSTCYDYFYARLRTSSGSTISTVQTKCNTNASGWTQYTFDVTSALRSYAGQSIQVYFAGTNDSVDVTDFYVDDVALNVTQ